jgi:hypothetical protein
MADYPSSKWGGNGSLTDLVDYWNASRANALNDEVVAIEEELGVDPAGEFGDVAARLDAGELTFVNVWDDDAGACVILPPWSYNGIDYPAVMVQKYPASQPVRREDPVHHDAALRRDGMAPDRIERADQADHRRDARAAFAAERVVRSAAAGWRALLLQVLRPVRDVLRRLAARGTG